MCYVFKGIEAKATGRYEANTRADDRKVLSGEQLGHEGLASTLGNVITARLTSVWSGLETGLPSKLTCGPKRHHWRNEVRSAKAPQGAASGSPWPGQRRPLTHRQWYSVRPAQILTLICRGMACSAIGAMIVSTPFW
jgi:hypothetical protein